MENKRIITRDNSSQCFCAGWVLRWDVIWSCRSVNWSRPQNLKKYWMDCHEISQTYMICRMKPNEFGGHLTFPLAASNQKLN